jgi:hypothetical protein
VGWRVLRGFSLYQAEKRRARKKSILRILYNFFDDVNVNALAQFGDGVARVRKRVLWSRLSCVNCWAESPLAMQLGPSWLLFRSFHRSLPFQLPFESSVSIVKNWSCPLPQCLTTHWARSVVQEHCLPNRDEHPKTNQRLRWELCWFIYKCLLTHTGTGAKTMNRDKCPFRDTSQDWATKRRCISTRDETKMSTPGLHNDWGTYYKVCYRIWPEHNFDKLCSENWVLLWVVRLGLTGVSSISELLTPNIVKDVKHPLVHFTTTTNQAWLPFISFFLVRCLVQNVGTLLNMTLVSNMSI